MKYFLSLLIFVVLVPINSHAIDGKGKLQLSEQALGSFIRYIKGDTSKKGKSAFNKPAVFWVTNDGQSAYWWYCPYSQCSDNSVEEKKACENAYGKDCSRFARARYVRWNNGINPKGSKAKFNSKMSDSEIRAKLSKLGFYNNNSTTTQKKEKKELVVSSENKTIVEQLKDLSELFKSGAITEEEFKKAKERLLVN